MELPIISLPSTSGAQLQVTAKSYANAARQAEDAAAILRAEAQAGTSHPRTIVDFTTKAIADLEAIRAATKAEIAAMDAAIRILDGEPVAASQHPLLMTAAEMKFTAGAFSKSSADLVADKAAGLVDETRNQLKACREAASRALADHDHRLDTLERRTRDALRSSIASCSGPLRVSLKEASRLLRLEGIPQDNSPLPAADFDPRLPADHPARAAAVLKTICASREAEAEMHRQHLAAKRAARVKPKSAVDVFRDDLALLGSR